jgi:hypothetical protein
MLLVKSCISCFVTDALDESIPPLGPMDERWEIEGMRIAGVVRRRELLP